MYSHTDVPQCLENPCMWAKDSSERSNACSRPISSLSKPVAMLCSDMCATRRYFTNPNENGWGASDGIVCLDTNGRECGRSGRRVLLQNTTFKVSLKKKE
eukprot:SAG31_NODE_210_length_20286_cov_22.684748_19_plen_100_part_00